MNKKIYEYLDCSKFMNFNEVLFYFIDKSGLKDSEIYKSVDIDRKLFSKIRCNEGYIPRKNIIIKLCFALRLTKLEADTLLNSAGYSFSRNKFDRLICYCLENKIYDLNIINDYLFTYCNAIL